MWSPRLWVTKRSNCEDFVDGYISEKGRVVAWAQPTGGYVLYEGDVAVADDLSWEPTTPATSARLRRPLLAASRAFGVIRQCTHV